MGEAHWDDDYLYVRAGWECFPGDHNSQTPFPVDQHKRVHRVTGDGRLPLRVSHRTATHTGREHGQRSATGVLRVDAVSGRHVAHELPDRDQRNDDARAHRRALREHRVPAQTPQVGAAAVGTSRDRGHMGIFSDIRCPAFNGVERATLL